MTVLFSAVDTLTLLVCEAVARLKRNAINGEMLGKL